MTDGIATTSLSEQVPVGEASGVGVGDELPAWAPFPVRVRAVDVAPGVATGVVTRASVLEGVAPTGEAVGPPDPPLPSRCATPKTRANATTTSSSRRVQYTRAGSGPRGRVTVVMASR